MSMTRNQMRFFYTSIAMLALCAGLYLGVINRGQDTPASALQSATLYPQAYPALPAFQLTDQDGVPFDNSRLTGRWTLLFFGYTYCPDVCPMTLQLLQTVTGKLATQDAGGDLQVVLVSVDPERDTPQRLRDYVHYFNPDFIGVSGPHDQLRTLTAGLGAFYGKAENQNDPQQYLVDHSAGLFLLSPAGRIRALFSAPLQANSIIEDFLTIYRYEH
jgi:protein SCO1/2